MPAHTLVRVVLHPIDEWERGNVFHVCELEDHPQGGYWIRNHRAADGVANDRTARRGWAHWTLNEGHMGERRVFAFIPIRNAHPDELRHLVGRKVIKLNLASVYAGRDAELTAILDRTLPSPISEGRLTKVALLAAPHGPNFGRDQAEVVMEMMRG